LLDVRGYLVGAFPRTQALIKLYRDFRKGKKGWEELAAEVDRGVEEVVQLQKSCGLSLLTDGMLTWEDLLRPVISCMEGVELNGLARWFDNNFFYKKPIIKGKISIKQGLSEYYYHYRHLMGVRAKAVFPEPYSTALLSENRAYGDLMELSASLADAIGRIAAELKNLQQLQLTSPAIVYNNLESDELEFVRESLKIVRNHVKCEIMLHMPYGSASKVLPKALEYPVDVIGIDLFKTPVRVLRDYSITKRLYVGLMDGRNSIIEGVEESLKVVENFLTMTGVKSLDIGPSDGFDLLPYEIAEAKTRRLAEILTKIKEVL